MPKCSPFWHFEQIKHIHLRRLSVYKFFGLHLISEKKHFNFWQRPLFIYLLILFVT